MSKIDCVLGGVVGGMLVAQVPMGILATCGLIAMFTVTFIALGIWLVLQVERILKGEFDWVGESIIEMVTSQVDYMNDVLNSAMDEVMDVVEDLNDAMWACVAQEWYIPQFQVVLVNHGALNNVPMMVFSNKLEKAPVQYTVRKEMKTAKV